MAMNVYGSASLSSGGAWQPLTVVPQSLITPSAHSGNLDVFSIMPSLTQNTTCSWSAQYRKLYTFSVPESQPGIPDTSGSRWETKRCAGWVAHIVQVYYAHGGWELIKHLTLPVFFLGGGVFCGMGLQNTFLLGHLGTGKHIFSIPWSGSQDNIKPVNCSKCHKGRAVAVVKSFVGYAHHMDHFLLDSSSWSHHAFNHLRERMFQAKLLRNLHANLHKLINACTFPKLLTH